MSVISKTLLKGPRADKLIEAFGYDNLFWEYKPGRLILPQGFHQMTSAIFESDVREDDVWVISYPKTGSTWVQEMVWLIGNDLNFDKATTTIQQLRAPMIELSIYFAELDEFQRKFQRSSVQICNDLPSPRFLKSHLMYDYLPRQMHKVKPKLIYVARNPKDVCVSYYHHMRRMYNVKITFRDFAELFLAGDVPIGNVFDHYLPYWRHKDDLNMLYLKYEDLVRRPKEGLQVVADFMEKRLTNEEMEAICSFLTVEKMRDNPGCNFVTVMGSNVVRKGIIGDWRNYMDDELSLRFDKFTEKHLQGTGLSFDDQ